MTDQATDHLNILIHQGLSGAAAVVAVRYKYSPLDEPEARSVIAAQTVYDPEATNRLGNPGAFACRHGSDQIEAAVARLRGHYGSHLPVQSNIPDHSLDRPLVIDGLVADSAKSAA